MYDDFCNQIRRSMTKWFIAGFWGHLKRNNNNVTVIFVVKLWLLRSLNQQSKPIWMWHIEDIVIWIICYNKVRIKRFRKKTIRILITEKDTKLYNKIWSLIKVNKTLSMSLWKYPSGYLFIVLFYQWIKCSSYSTYYLGCILNVCIELLIGQI